MDDFSPQASEAEQIACEGKQTRYWRRTTLNHKEHATQGTEITSPWIEFVTPWMDTKRYPDTKNAHTFAQRASPVVNGNKHSNSNSLSPLTQTYLNEFIVNLWLFWSTPAGPSQSSTSRPNTRDTALTSVDGEKQKAEDISFHSTTTGAGASAHFPDSTLDWVQQPLVPQMDGSTDVPESSAANQSEPQTARLSTKDPFFDSVPKGPSQLSISRWDARSLTFNPLDSTRDQTPSSLLNKMETSFGPGEHP